MKLDQLQNKLLAAARANPPADHVPLAFEKRVLAHLAIKPVSDVAAFWSRALWRATVPCLALTLVLAAISFYPTRPTNTATSVVASNASTPIAPNPEDLSTVFEQTLLASSDSLTTFDYLEENP